MANYYNRGQGPSVPYGDTMAKLIYFTTVLIGAVYLTTGVLGESCDPKSAPAMGAIESCCKLDTKKNEMTPKQKESMEHAKACFEARRNEYEPLSDEEVQQKKGKFDQYNCMSECIYKKTGMLGNDGALDKKKFIQMTKESFPEESVQKPAVDAATTCIEKMDRANICSQAKGMLQVTKCFMAEMILNCPDKLFNKTEVCKKGREYLKTCKDAFVQMRGSN